MRKRWLTPLLALALIASLLMHVTVAFGDLIWDWWLSDAPLKDELLKPTKRRLQHQTMDSAKGTPAALIGVQPVETLMVTLAAPTPHPVHTNSPMPVYHADGASPRTRATRKPTAPAPLAKSQAKPTTPETPAISPPPAPAPATPAPTIDAVATASAQPTQITPPGNTDQPKADARPVVDAAFPQSATINYLLNSFAPLEAKWQVSGEHYQLTLNIGMLGKASSEGEIDEHGLKPSQYRQFKVNDPQPRYQVDFDWAGKVVRVGEPGKQKEEALMPGAVDVFSAGYQFALLGDRVPSFEIQVLTGRASYHVAFALKGEAVLTLSGVSVPTLVLGGTKETRSFDYYLAPDWHNLPVRIRYSDGEKRYDLIATQVVIDDKLVLARRVHKGIDR